MPQRLSQLQASAPEVSARSKPLQSMIGGSQPVTEASLDTASNAYNPWRRRNGEPPRQVLLSSLRQEGESVRTLKPPPSRPPQSS
jgi:hypothetical protein